MIAPIFEKMYQSKKWNDLFIGVGEDLRNLEHDKGELYDQICILFSEEHLKTIAKTKRNAGFELLEQVENKLVNYLKKMKWCIVK